ncbi:hypothetical protein AMECASPLE_027136 [Ameca splendens]|uniref:Uncharacterized protein n=1 Tax=Ameca splendens TaxID=208324 RepID=A0ABV0XI54_9TELE
MLLVNDEPLFIDYLLVSDQSTLFILSLLAGISRCNLGTVVRWTGEEEGMLNFLAEQLFFLVSIKLNNFCSAEFWKTEKLCCSASDVCLHTSLEESSSCRNDVQFRGTAVNMHVFLQSGFGATCLCLFTLNNKKSWVNVKGSHL